MLCWRTVHEVSFLEEKGASAYLGLGTGSGEDMWCCPRIEIRVYRQWPGIGTIREQLQYKPYEETNPFLLAPVGQLGQANTE